MRNLTKTIFLPPLQSTRRTSAENISKMLRTRPAPSVLHAKNVLVDPKQQLNNLHRRKNSAIELDKLLSNRPLPDASRQRTNSAIQLESKLKDRPSEETLKEKNVIVDGEEVTSRRRSSVDMLNTMILAKEEMANDGDNEYDSNKNNIKPETESKTKAIIPIRKYKPIMNNNSVWNNAQGPIFKTEMGKARRERKVGAMRKDRRKAHLTKSRERVSVYNEVVGGFPRFPTGQAPSDRRVSESKRQFVHYGYYPQ
mgnify:CR=1 FL=1